MEMVVRFGGGLARGFHSFRRAHLRADAQPEMRRRAEIRTASAPSLLYSDSPYP